MTQNAIIHAVTRRFGKLTRVPVCVLLLALSWSLPVGAQEGEEKAETPLGLEYAVSIDPEKQQLAVTCTIQGYEGKPIRQFESRGMREKVTVLALHTPARPRKHFEFLGMLAHEHLHNWYPNAMRSDLGPWFMEGLTDVLLDLIRDKPPGGVVQRAHFLARLKFSGEDMEALYKHLVEDDGAIDLAKYLAGTGFTIADNRNIEIRPETESEKKLFEAILSEGAVLP